MENAGISYEKLRQTIGWLGILLPILVYVESVTIGNCHCLQDSISHYYYTVSNSFFVGILWGLGLVLLYYPSHPTDPKHEGVLTTIAGICSICVSLFPTTPYSSDSCALFAWGESNWRAGIHFACAGIMLLIFSYMSIAIFTRTYPGNDLTGPENRWKRRRNRLYIVTGSLTLLSVFLIGVFGIVTHFNPDFPISPKYTFWLEVSALLSFGLAWIVKGGFIFTDAGEKSTVEKVKEIITSKTDNTKE
jgi:hypothetical protein